ncbi:MAG: ADP-L-glycero-D-manno-heptose-6-epimerase [Chlamydiae bacterium]|nr:ADP-L-glycero-D-manno-heptose-6-epimerase [Chlamydiota bacterium]
MKDRIIIVTGAAGFIGSAVARHLNDLGYHRLLLVDDIEKTEKWKNLLGKKFYDFISKHDLFSWLIDHADEVGGIIHLGACSDTLEKDGDYLMENNFHYTQILAEFALENDVRFIYASSAATYGDGRQGFSDDTDQLEELRPLNLYGFSKHFFDLWAKQQGILDRIVGLKYFNVFGPNENHKGHMASMVYKMLPKVTNEGVVHLFRSSDPDNFGDGQQCRDFIYIKDVARLTCDFLFNNISGIFNIGRGTPTTWNELASALFEAIGKEKNIQYIDMPEDLVKQYQNYTCADMQKFLKKHQKTEAISTYNIKDAVCDYVQGYLLKDQRW